MPLFLYISRDFWVIFHLELALVVVEPVRLWLPFAEHTASQSIQIKPNNYKTTN